MKIVIIGLGNVGKALYSYFSNSYDVLAIDIEDKDIQVSKDYRDVKDADYIFISVPTTYNESINGLDTSIVTNAVKEVLKYNRTAPIFIKSTVNVGFTRKLINETNYNYIYYTPEFLRQDHALEDIKNPSRIVIGCKDDKYVKEYLDLFNSDKKFALSLEEAEASKLFSNTYLATRIAFFNELDTFCEINHLSPIKIIEAVSSDPRIGDYYNKPSYGYGGYCLPKDAKQLDSLYEDEPHHIIEATLLSNEQRKNHIVDEIIKRSKNKIVGIYGKIKKYSPLNDIVIKLMNNNIQVIVFDYNVDNNLEEFINKVDVILSEEKELPLSLPKEKLYLK